MILLNICDVHFSDYFRICLKKCLTVKLKYYTFMTESINKEITSEAQMIFLCPAI